MAALLRKELREHLFSRKGLIILFVLSLLYSILAFSFISVKELSLLAQAEVNMTFLRLMLGAGSLVLIVIGSTLVSGEKEKGTLESLLLTPLSNMKILMAKMMGIMIIWLVILLLSIPYVAALTAGTQLFPSVLIYLLLIGTPLVLSFAGLALAFSAAVSSTKNAMLLSIVIFMAAVIPMFLSTTNKKVGFAHTVNQISPVSAGMTAMKDILVNKLGAVAIFHDAIPIIGFLIIIGAAIALTGRRGDFLRGEGQ